MKKWLILVIGGLLLGVAGGGFYLLLTKAPKEQPELSITQPTPTTSPMILKTWNDPAGFSLKYPENLTLDPHPEDNANYAHLEFKDKTQSGSLIIWMTDLPVGIATIDDWVKKEPRFADGAVFDTTLGGKPGKKILLKEPTKRFLVGTIDEDVLVYLEAQLDEANLWQKVADTIVTNFAFVSEKKEAQTSAGSGDYGSEEEPVDEEVIVE